MTKQLTRQKVGKNFQYRYPDGTKIEDTVMLQRIKRLAIPPAWQDVAIAKGPRAKVQATGIDDAGRRQYIYNPVFRAKQEAAKFDRIVLFGKHLPKLRRQIQKDIRRRRLDKAKVTACAIHVMDEAYFRVGNSNYAAAHQTYGLTTLRSKHLDIHGDTVVFDFIGKSHQQQHQELKSRTLARLMKQLDETPGYELFRYYDEQGTLHNLTSSDINEYIKSVMGDDYTAKDFRTWGGTLLACVELSQIPAATSATEQKKNVTTCIKKVASVLGNTPAVTRQSYVDPRVLSFFSEKGNARHTKLTDSLRRANDAAYTPTVERCALKILTA